MIINGHNFIYIKYGDEAFEYKWRSINTGGMAMDLIYYKCVNCNLNILDIKNVLISCNEQIIKNIIE